MNRKPATMTGSHTETMALLRQRLGKRLFKSFMKPDWVPEDDAICYVRFLFDASRAGF